jgi:hypothetical protein
MDRVRVWQLTLLLSWASACGEAHTSTGPRQDADDGGLPTSDADTGEPDASTLTPYVLCDGSDDVRFGLAERGEGLSNPARVFTHPYGASFLYITGQCEYVAGEDRVGGGLVVGTLDAAQAATLENTLEMARLSTMALDDEETCDDAGAVVATRLGYGYCRCRCQEGAEVALERIVAAARQTQAALYEAGPPPSGDLEVGGFVTEQGLARPLHPWPLALDLTSISLPSWRGGGAYPETLPTLTVSGADAEALRELRGAEPEDGLFGDARFVEQNGAFYELYLLDPVPERLDAAIRAFPHTPRH